MSDFSSFGAKLPPQTTEQSEEDTTTQSEEDTTTAAVEDVTEETDYNNVEATTIVTDTSTDDYETTTMSEVIDGEEEKDNKMIMKVKKVTIRNFAKE